MLIGVTGIHWQGLAREHAPRPDGGKKDLFAHPQTEIESQRAAFREMLEDSPVFDPLFERYATAFTRFPAGED